MKNEIAIIVDYNGDIRNVRVPFEDEEEYDKELVVKGKVVDILNVERPIRNSLVELRPFKLIEAISKIAELGESCYTPLCAILEAFPYYNIQFALESYENNDVEVFSMDVEEYGKYLVKELFHGCMCSELEWLKEYIDFERVGEDGIEERGGIITSYGIVMS